MFRSAGKENYLNNNNIKILKEIITTNTKQIKDFIQNSFESKNSKKIQEFNLNKIYINNIIDLNYQLQEEYEKIGEENKMRYSDLLHNLGNFSTVLSLSLPLIEQYFKIEQQNLKNKEDIKEYMEPIGHSIKRLEKILKII